MNRAQVLRDVLRREGGWRVVTDRAADKGGLTISGVTFDSYNKYRVSRGLAPWTRAEFLANLTEADALQFFDAEHLAPFDPVARVDERTAVLLGDWAITSGPDDPIEGLQLALAAQGLYAGKVDGILGGKTLAALSKPIDVPQLYRDCFAARQSFYEDLALRPAEVVEFLKAHPRSNLHNLHGWLNRTREFLP